LTGHNEVVLVVFDPTVIAYQTLLSIFWQGHNPTLGMRQGNDIGTQYRSGIYCVDMLQQADAEASALRYQEQLDIAGKAKITTEILQATVFYYAEPYHQQYLAKNPAGYCPDISCHATGLPVFPS
jgi:peptide-methionine (S)-S-oxide reductase